MRVPTLISLLLLIAVSVAAVEPPPLYLRTLGGSGPAFGRLQSPTGLAFESNGGLLVSDGARSRIVEFIAASNNVVNVLATVGAPRGVTCLPNGDVYACSNVAPGWTLVFSLAPTPWTQPVPITASYGITCDPATGTLFKSETNIARVSGGGIFVSLPPGSLPAGLAFADGQLYVACAGDHQVRVIEASGVRGSWGGFGSGPGQFNAPQGICVDGDAVYVADTQNHRIEKFTRSGVFLTQWGTFGTGPGQLNQPVGVAVSGNGEIYVVEFGNSRVSVFGQAPVAVRRTTWGRIKALAR